jgi:hypothetical protein
MSNKYKVAHLLEQGVNIIIVPLESSFGSKTSSQQNEIIQSLEICASSARLAGGVVPVWLSGSSMNFIAPPNQHAFFKSISWDFVMQNINKELTCG